MKNFNFKRSEETINVVSNQQVINLDEIRILDEVLNNGEEKRSYIRLTMKENIPTANITVTSGIKERFETAVDVELANELIGFLFTGTCDFSESLKKEHSIPNDVDFIKDMVRAEREAGRKLAREKDIVIGENRHICLTSRFDFGILTYLIDYSKDFEAELRQAFVPVTKTVDVENLDI